MELVKIILTALRSEVDSIVKYYNLSEKEVLESGVVYEGMREEQEGEKEKIVLIHSQLGKEFITNATRYAFENYDVFKIVHFGIAGGIGGNDISIGDVILPNTFVLHKADSDQGKPIFLEYAVGDHYNLTKFGLILSGICITGNEPSFDSQEVSELQAAYGEGIVDGEAFFVLSVVREYDALDRCVVIKSVADGANEVVTDECMSNTEFALSNGIKILDVLL